MLRPLAELFVRLGLETSQFDKGLAASKTQLTSAADQMKSLFGQMGIAFSAGALIRGAIGAAAGAEEFISRMEIVLGDLKEAVRLEGILSQFEMAKGLRENIEPAVMALIRAGTTVDEMPKKLEFLADVAAGTGGSVNSLANAIIRMQQTPMQSRALEMMFRRAGVHLGSVAKQLGITEEAWQEMVASNKVGTTEILAMFDQLTKAGGKWGDASEKQARTWYSLWERLKKTMGEASESMGAGLLPTLKGVIEQMVLGLGSVLKFDEATGGLLGKLAMGALVVVQFQSGLAIFNRIMGTALGPLGAVVKLLGLFGRSAIWGAGIAAIALGLWGAVKAFRAFGEWLTKTPEWLERSNRVTASWNVTVANFKTIGVDAFRSFQDVGSWALESLQSDIDDTFGKKGKDSVANFFATAREGWADLLRDASTVLRALAAGGRETPKTMTSSFVAGMWDLKAIFANWTKDVALGLGGNETDWKRWAASINRETNAVEDLADKQADALVAAADKIRKEHEKAAAAAAAAARKPPKAMRDEVAKLKVDMFDITELWSRTVKRMNEEEKGGVIRRFGAPELPAVGAAGRAEREHIRGLASGLTALGLGREDVPEGWGGHKKKGGIIGEMAWPREPLGSPTEPGTRFVSDKDAAAIVEKMKETGLVFQEAAARMRDASLNIEAASELGWNVSTATG